jgi:hypothetical protein
VDKEAALDEHLSRLLSHPYVGELRELAKEYYIAVGEVLITVKVYRYPYDDTYVAIPNYGVQRSGEAVPYRRMEHLSTAEEALEDSVGSLLEQYNPDEGQGCLARIE